MAINPLKWRTGQYTEDKDYKPFVLLCSDDTNAYIIGEQMMQVMAVRDALTRLIETGRPDEQLKRLDPRLLKWITTAQAAKEYSIPKTTIQAALDRGEIKPAQKIGDAKTAAWTFPERRFRHWLRNRPRRGRPPNT